MPINVVCACGQNYPVREEFAGQRIQCTRCGRVLTVPGAPVQAVTAPSRPSRLAPHPSAPPREEAERPAARRGCGLTAVLLALLAILLIGCGGTAGVLVYVFWDQKPAEEAANDEIEAEADPPAPVPEEVTPPGD